jgi:hypothetical protein
MKRAYSTAALGAAIFLLLSSCNNGYGILAEIQTEKENTSTSIFYRSSVQAFTRFKDNYYAVTNAIYSRAVTPVTGWAQVAVGIYDKAYRCRSIAATSTALYAVIRDSSDSMVGVYSTTDGSTFTAMSATFGGTPAASMDVQALYAAGPAGSETLFAVARDSSSDYVLYYLNGGNFATTGISGSGWIPGVVYAGGNYWTTDYSAASSTATVYYGSNTTWSSAKAISDVVFTSIAADTSSTPNRVFVGTKTGTVYAAATSAPATWNDGVQAWNSADTAAVKALVYLPTSNELVAGRGMQDSYTSTFYGYYEIPLNDSPSISFKTPLKGSDSSAVLKTNYSTTTQYLFVNGFYYDETAKRLFILENSSMKKLAALWSNTWDGTSLWGGWTTE